MYKEFNVNWTIFGHSSFYQNISDNEAGVIAKRVSDMQCGLTPDSLFRRILKAYKHRS